MKCYLTSSKRNDNVLSQKPLVGTLSLRNHNAQISENYGTIKALKKSAELGIPKKPLCV
ncbi:hypothetical protein [Candidatus Enterovibrio altilux]|uniref:hypothetical protein n=1 Tax=Candidatus Enterovibrio altilux TaxID=1927128 RepID=UPI0037449BD4